MNKKEIKWDAICSIVTCVAICLTSIAGFISIKLSAKALEISEDMKIISQCSMQIEKNNSNSNLLMDGVTVFNRDDLNEGVTVLKNFHDYFCDVMKLPGDLLYKIARIRFGDGHENINYLKLKYDLDDNLAYVVKFYLEKNFHIMKYNKYYNTNQILIDYWNKINFAEKRIYAQSGSEEDVKYIFNILIPKYIICLMYKIYKEDAKLACKLYYPELLYNNFQSLHFFDLNYVKQQLELLEKAGKRNSNEYILFKNFRNYLIDRK